MRQARTDRRSSGRRHVGRVARRDLAVADTAGASLHVSVAKRAAAMRAAGPRRTAQATTPNWPKPNDLAADDAVKAERRAAVAKASVAPSPNCELRLQQSRRRHRKQALDVELTAARDALAKAEQTAAADRLQKPMQLYAVGRSQADDHEVHRDQQQMIRQVKFPIAEHGPANGAGRLDYRPQQSADGPSRRQPYLESAYGNAAGCQPSSISAEGSSANESGIARLARGRIDRERLGHEASASADRELRDVSHVVVGSWTRSKCRQGS